ncbi:hypothetical protein COEREDRAFT_83875 [Coemansia reversa NRRL 1564]|uniref:Uncharacterized protein n=1 Tax=Coemansia reversa (strain ATCC 12441 / NRRL 1564) TaxID=763665 RepID=A0A2G5B1C3_COERN|nr:hypothetical protein COEREDRAFT_83875 [Coemansia reversa NRRL 1564]|eukprot:PIA12813.1 hypothetical protein COEREDRAFT_83875 [Coemansia reversa NRRL 1564]
MSQDMCSCHWLLPTPLPTPTQNHTANDHAQTTPPPATQTHYIIGANPAIPTPPK